MKQMSGLVMTLIFVGVPLCFALAVTIRGAIRMAQQRRFDRAHRPHTPRPGPPRLE